LESLASGPRWSGEYYAATGLPFAATRTGGWEMPGRFEDATQLNGAMDRYLARWAWVRRSNMEAFAEQTARWMECARTPRYASDALRSLGICITREALPPGVLAVWSVGESRYHIRLSPFLSGPRANFTLWHEWFEIMAARPRFPRPPTGREGERMADFFAASITMPAMEVRRAALGFRSADDKSSVLAARFGVGTAAMRVRLRELGVTPFGRAGDRVPHII
jgi:hypothetical protein